MFDPLIKTPSPPPPTHNTTLHTGLMLTRGSSAFVVGSHKRIIRTYDLDIYKCALQIQQSVVNTNWILQAGGSASRYIVFAALHDLDKTISESDIDTIMCH